MYVIHATPFLYGSAGSIEQFYVDRATQKAHAKVAFDGGFATVLPLAWLAHVAPVKGESLPITEKAAAPRLRRNTQTNRAISLVSAPQDDSCATRSLGPRTKRPEDSLEARFPSSVISWTHHASAVSRNIAKRK